MVTEASGMGVGGRPNLEPRGWPTVMRVGRWRMERMVASMSRR